MYKVTKDKTAISQGIVPNLVSSVSGMVRRQTLGTKSESYLDTEHMNARFRQFSRQIHVVVNIVLRAFWIGYVAGV